MGNEEFIVKGVVCYDKEGTPHFTVSYDYLKEQNQLLQGKILDFYAKHQNYKDLVFASTLLKEYKEHFNIKTDTNGRI